MITIRTASGLGDGMYLIPIIKYLIGQGNKVGVITHWRELYSKFCDVLAYDRYCRVDRDATYVMRRENKTTNQYEDVCDAAGVPRIPFETDYESHNHIGGEMFIRNYNKPPEKKLCVIRAPYYREGKGQLKNEDLVPDVTIYNEIIKKYKNEYYFVNVGNGRDKTIELTGIDADVSGMTNINQLLWLVNNSDMVITQCGHLLPMAEAFNKRCFVIFNDKIHESEKYLVKTATPEKVITKGGTEYVYSGNAEKALSRFELYNKLEILKNQVTTLQIDNEIRGKRVAVFGSAPSCLDNDGANIDKYDTIVRVNGTDADVSMYGERIGHRTDIHYSFYGSSIKRTVDGLKKEKVKYLWSKIPYCDFTKHYQFAPEESRGMLNFRKYFENFRFDGIPIYLPKTKELINECKIVDRMLTSGVSAIVNIIAHKPKELYITGFDLFASGKHNINQDWRKKDGGHKTDDERAYLLQLIRDNSNIVTVDKRLKELLNGR